MRRSLILAALLLLPTGALAEDAASTLGPQSDSSQSASSPQTSGILQPANGSSSPLQSASGNSANAAQQTGGADLQQAGGAEQAKLFIQGDVDSTETPDEGHNLTLVWDFLLVLLAAGSGTAAVLLWQRRVQQPSK